MAFDFMSALGGVVGTVAPLALPGIGNVVGAVAPGIFQGLSDAFGLSDPGGGPGSSVQEQADNAAMLQRKLLLSKAGYQGADASRMAQQKLGQYENTNSADSIFSQNVLRGLGSNALGAAQQQTDVMAQMQAQQAGAMRRGLLDTMRMSGGPASATAGAARDFGQQNTQALTSLLAQGGQNAMQGLNQAGSLFAQADQARMSDMAQRMSFTEPYMVQDGAANATGALSNTVQNASAMQGMKMAEDPNALMKRLGGAASGFGLEGVQRQVSGLGSQNLSAEEMEMIKRMLAKYS